MSPVTEETVNDTVTLLKIKDYGGIEYERP